MNIFKKVIEYLLNHKVVIVDQDDEIDLLNSKLIRSYKTGDPKIIQKYEDDLEKAKRNKK